MAGVHGLLFSLCYSARIAGVRQRGAAAARSAHGADVEHCGREKRRRASALLPHDSAQRAPSAPLLPRMKASPYLFFSCPLEYSWRRRTEQEKRQHSDTRALGKARRCVSLYVAGGTRLRLLHRDVHVAVQARQRACPAQAHRRSVSERSAEGPTLAGAPRHAAVALPGAQPGPACGAQYARQRAAAAAAGAALGDIGAPRYSTPLLSLTTTGRPLMLFRKSAGLFVVAAASAMRPERAGVVRCTTSCTGSAALFRCRHTARSLLRCCQLQHLGAAAAMADALAQERSRLEYQFNALNAEKALHVEKIAHLERTVTELTRQSTNDAFQAARKCVPRPAVGAATGSEICASGAREPHCRPETAVSPACVVAAGSRCAEHRARASRARKRFLRAARRRPGCIAPFMPLCRGTGCALWPDARLCRLAAQAGGEGARA